MSATIINLIVQIIAWVIGGNAVGAGMKEASLGTAGNAIAGALGGLGGGQLLAAVIPPIATGIAGRFVPNERSS
jgi:sugar (pentulose or hexulose) kinase